MADTTTVSAVEPIELVDLTQATIEGAGAFDVLMRAMKGHLEQEFSKNRIKGPEYSQVYLGSLQSVMSTALQFLMAKNQANQEVRLKELQIELARVEVQKAQAQLAQIQAQSQNLAAQKLQIEAETALTVQKTANAVIEATVLTAQECKLRAEYDNLLLAKGRTTAETSLLEQKIVTEKAQVTSLGVDDDSVVGRQKLLYKAQTDGFQRDAEQKAAKLMVDSWNARRMTDDATAATDVNQLTDPFIGRAVSKLLAGINA